MHKRFICSNSDVVRATRGAHILCSVLVKKNISVAIAECHEDAWCSLVTHNGCTAKVVVHALWMFSASTVVSSQTYMSTYFFLMACGHDDASGTERRKSPRLNHGKVVQPSSRLCILCAGVFSGFFEKNGTKTSKAKVFLNLSRPVTQNADA